MHPVRASVPDTAPKSRFDIHHVCDRYFHRLAALILCFAAVLQFCVMRGESPTMDEAWHLFVGYNYLRTGTIPLTSEHPPLSQAIAALPLLALDLHNPGLRPNIEGQTTREQEFLFLNRYPAQT